MITNPQIFESNISMFDSSFGMKDWETGDDYINRVGQWMSFEAKLNDKIISFDINFAITGTCKWFIERGDYFQPDFFEQNDIDINILLEDFYSDDIELDITDTKTKGFLTNLIMSNLK